MFMGSFPVETFYSLPLFVYVCCRQRSTQIQLSKVKCSIYKHIIWFLVSIIFSLWKFHFAWDSVFLGQNTVAVRNLILMLPQNTGILQPTNIASLPTRTESSAAPLGKLQNLTPLLLLLLLLLFVVCYYYYYFYYFLLLNTSLKNWADVLCKDV